MQNNKNGLQFAGLSACSLYFYLNSSAGKHFKTKYFMPKLGKTDLTEMNNNNFVYTLNVVIMKMKQYSIRGKSIKQYMWNKVE